MENQLLAELPYRGPRKTKVIATIGPASRGLEKIEALIKAGVNVFRLNFSHGTFDEHLQVLKDIRILEKKLGIHVAILQDLAGPKVRITTATADFFHVSDDALIDLYYGRDLSSSEKLYIENLDPTGILKPGHHVLLADGIVTLVTKEVNEKYVRCKVLKGGRLRPRVGIAFPDSVVDLPATTDRDMECLEWGIENQVDFVAISFVQNAADIMKIKSRIAEKGGHSRIIAKIERKQAIANIFEIMDAADSVMVARGDLGVELPMAQVPMTQKRLIEECNYRGIPVIVATQMLHSMVQSLRPTRAEVSDVSTAVMSGADAVMLSDETAIGEHPVQCVQTLCQIAHETERGFSFEEYRLRLRGADMATVTDAVAYAACAAAYKLDAAAVVACTESGTSARLLAKYRPAQPLYAVSARVETLRRMALYWGVITIYSPSDDTECEIRSAIDVVQEREKVLIGKKAVIISGLKSRTPGLTNMLQVREFMG